MLLNRIGGYLVKEEFRPKLRIAIIRLEEGKNALAQHAKGLPVWPKVRNRQAAVKKFDELMDRLREYLGKLGYTGNSAFALKELQELQEIAKTGPPEDFEKQVDELLLNLDETNLFTVTGNCYRVIEILHLAFR